MSTSSYTKEEALEIGKVIYDQIPVMTKMQAAARDFVAGNLNPDEEITEPGLMFRVTKVSKPRTFHKIIITLDAGRDLYNVYLVKIARNSCESTVVEQMDGVYADMLDEIIFKMTS